MARPSQNSRPDPLPALCASQSGEREPDRHEIFRMKVLLDRQEDGWGASHYHHHQQFPAAAPTSRSSEHGDYASKEHQPTEISEQHCFRRSARSGGPFRYCNHRCRTVRTKRSRRRKRYPVADPKQPNECSRHQRVQGRYAGSARRGVGARGNRMGNRPCGRSRQSRIKLRRSPKESGQTHKLDGGQ